MKRAAWACVLLLAGCAAQEEAEPLHTEVTTQPAPDPFEGLDEAVAAIEEETGTEVGVALFDGSEMTQSGSLYALPAWSTIKVPIAVAAMRANPGLEADARAAVSASDNAAAQRLYDAVGPGAVDAVLEDAGLAAHVNTEPLRPEFSAFGQTQLGVADEAALANTVACVEGADPVLQFMGQIDPSQAYGLGVAGALFKGGWGPDPAGAYQVRQFGLVPRGDGTWAPVALTALPADGTYETGQEMLTAAAETLAADPAQLPAAACQP